MDKHTKIKSINIQKFRGLENLNIDFADRLTFICGKNGTSKSTILGIIAQIFSFKNDYLESSDEKTDLSDYKSLLGKAFESKFSEHFRLSEKFDKPGTMDITIKVFDGMDGLDKDDLSLQLYNSKDRKNLDLY